MYCVMIVFPTSCQAHRLCGFIALSTLLTDQNLERPLPHSARDILLGDEDVNFDFDIEEDKRAAQLIMGYLLHYDLMSPLLDMVGNMYTVHHTIGSTDHLHVQDCESAYLDFLDVVRANAAERIKAHIAEMDRLVDSLNKRKRSVEPVDKDTPSKKCKKEKDTDSDGESKSEEF
jgi:hypothetical protein